MYKSVLAWGGGRMIHIETTRQDVFDLKKKF